MTKISDRSERHLMFTRRCTSKDVMLEYRLSQGERLITVTPKGTFSRRRVSKAPVLDLIERLDWVNEHGAKVEPRAAVPLVGPASYIDILNEVGGVIELKTAAPPFVWDEDDGA